MLKYIIGDLSETTITHLAKLQAKVNALPSHAEQYALANDLFSSKTNAAFKEIKAKLAEHAPGGDACYYCERDRFRDIEHIKPKRHYPQSCFDWGNYVYACTICNQDRKSDHFAVFDPTGEVIEFNRQWDINIPIPTGPQVLIDLRTEDPLDFLKLDLETGVFIPIGNERAKKRGKFTKDLFILNDAMLARIRKNAYDSFNNQLNNYQIAYAAGDQTKATIALNEIRQLGNPTVLVEMRRQAPLIPALARLFNNVPAEIGRRG